MPRKDETAPLAVCGDVHGHLQLALCAWALHQQAVGVDLDAILLCGDVGTFSPTCQIDKATRRHAFDNPCELEFRDWSRDSPARWLDGIFADVSAGGLGLRAPVIMVTGNHEGFARIAEILAGVPARPPDEPVAVRDLPAVDRRDRIRLLPPGWRVRTGAGRVVAGIGGIQPGQRLGARYPDTAYIHPRAVHSLREAGRVDVLITHQGPARVQGPSSGAEILDALLDPPVPRQWFHGHSRLVKEPVTIGRTTVHPLGDATFDRSADWRVGQDAWAYVTGPLDAPETFTGAPHRLAELNRGAWLPARGPGLAPALVAPHLAGWIDDSAP